MENIDITDPNFALSNTNLDYNNTILNYANPLWIYVGIFIFVFFSGIIFYNYYQTKKQTYNKDKLNCPDEFYNINNTNIET
jgi:hypothetical protein